MKDFDESWIERNRKISIGMYGLVVICVLVIVLYTFLVSSHNILVYAMLFLVASICFVVAIFLKIKMTPFLAMFLMRRVCSSCGDLEFAFDKGIPEKYFVKSNFIKNYVSYRSCNFYGGRVDNRDFILSEIAVRNKKPSNTQNETVVVFQGIFGMTDVANGGGLNMVIAPDVKNKFLNSFSDDFKKMFGGDKGIIRLENMEFERNFEVYSDNPIEARKVVTLKFMEVLLELKKRLNKNVTLIYQGNKVYVFVENEFLIDVNKVYWNGVSDSIAYETVERLDLIREIIKIV